MVTMILTQQGVLDMSMTAVDQMTGLLDRWRAGDREAESELMSHLYPVLRAMAQREVGAGEAGKLAMRATDLAHEVYLRLLDQHSPWQNRAHFMAIVGRTIRRVAVDLLRQRQAEKRGSQIDFVTFDWHDEKDQPAADDAVDLLALDQALEALAQCEAVAAQVVELRY
ncbi:MAG TPA: ECF-type sigma factor, partial [Xanthomonadaceae bacterium]|nr:ECF-type sigma factor [Xanthomonadaceae bacterium]